MQNENCHNWYKTLFYYLRHYVGVAERGMLPPEDIPANLLMQCVMVSHPELPETAAKEIFDGINQAARTVIEKYKPAPVEHPAVTTEVPDVFAQAFGDDSEK